MNERGTETVTKAIAWLGIVVGSLGALSNAVSYLLLDGFSAKNLPNGTAPEFMKGLEDNMRWQRPLSLAIIPVLILAVVAGRGLLQRKAWSPKAMEAAAWGFGAFTIANVAIFFMTLQTGVTPGMSKDKLFQAIFVTAMRVSAVFFNAIYLSAIGAVIYFLRRKETRALMSED